MVEVIARARPVGREAGLTCPVCRKSCVCALSGAREEFAQGLICTGCGTTTSGREALRYWPTARAFGREESDTPTPVDPWIRR